MALQDDDGVDSAPCSVAGAAQMPLLGRYALREEMGRGGVGIVYRAWQGDLKRDVALKLLAESRRDSADARQRFLREAELMAALDHPSILPVFEVGEQDGVPWYTMKLADGSDLSARIAQFEGRPAAAARLVARLARAIGYAHGRGVLHRDLKPSNVVFDVAGEPMLTDFGLARRLTADPSLTGFDALIGTPCYVAPEVVGTAADQLTTAVDIYGLGAILYELLCGQAPFAELTPVQILRQVTRRRPVPPRQLRASVPPALEAICLRCLEKQPGDRFASAEALAEALEGWDAQPHPSWARAWRRLSRLALPSRRRAWAVAALASLLACALAAAAVLWQQRAVLATPEPRIAMRTLAVLPADLPHASNADLAAARAITARLHGMRALDVLPAGDVLRRAQQPSFPAPAFARGMALGAFVQVQVRTDAASRRVRVRAVDGLRQEILWRDEASDGDVDALAGRLRAALESTRRLAPPEARVPRAALADYVRGKNLYRDAESGRNDAAIEAFQSAIQRTPGFALAHAALSLAYAERAKRYGSAAFWNDTAISEAERAISLDSRSAEAWYSLGIAYYYKGWLQRGETAFRRSAALGGAVEGILGVIAHQAGRFDESFALRLRVLEFAPPSAHEYYWAAQPLFALGESEAATKWMRAAIASDSNAGRRRLMEAEIAYHHGDFARCRALAEPLPPDLISGGVASANDYARLCAEQQHDWAAALRMMQHELDHYASGTGDAYFDNPPLEHAVLLRQLERNTEANSTLAAAKRKEQATIDGGDEHFGTFLRMAAILRMEGDEAGAYRMLETAATHGLTSNPVTDRRYEFLPFKDDARFAAWQARSRAQVATMRARIQPLLTAPGLRANPTTHPTGNPPAESPE